MDKPKQEKWGLTFIIWLLFCVIVVLNVVDATQTIMLLELGENEANPLMAWFIDTSGGWLQIIYLVKALPMLVLALLLLVNQRRTR